MQEKPFMFDNKPLPAVWNVFCSIVSTDALVGQTIGRCRIEKLLGGGGMGAVYQGMHEALRIPVAVKFLSLGGPGTAVDGAMAARFMREAQLAATLRHPNIVRIYDVNQ